MSLRDFSGNASEENIRGHGVEKIYLT
jgi:hypothetical protein